MNLEEITQHALQLPHPARAHLAADLLHSMRPPDLIEPSDDLIQRMQKVHSGELQGSAADAAIAEARTVLRSSRGMFAGMNTDFEREPDREL